MSVIKSGLKSLFTIAKNAATGVEQRVTPEKAKERLGICMKCPELIKATKQCGSCLCFVSYKVLYLQEKCPIGKWGAEEQKDEPLE